MGQPLGGLLAHPERHWSIFRTPFWLRYPFALPCFGAAIVAFVMSAIGYFVLHEVSISLCFRLGQLNALTLCQTLSPKVKEISKPPNHGRNEIAPTYDALIEEAANHVSEQLRLGDEPPVKANITTVLFTPSIISLLINTTVMVLSSEMIFGV